MGVPYTDSSVSASNPIPFYTTQGVTLYLMSLPIGYLLCQEFYPKRLPWAHIPGFVLAVLLWPFVLLLRLRAGR